MGYFVLFLFLFVLGGFVWVFDLFGLGMLGGWIAVILIVIGLIIWFAVVARHKEGRDY